MSDLFGNYRSQSTLQLQRIDSSKYPDTNKDFESNLRRLNGFVDYISQYLQQMQKGVDQANRDPLTAIRDVVQDLGALLAGGALLNDIDLGDLQYYLPAIGALFGFNNGQPFPINLLYAAEHFLLGYIVPLDSFAFVIEDLIAGWAEVFGLSPEFMESISELLEAIQNVTNDVVGFLQVLMDLIGVFGIDTTGEGLGVFGDIWHAISKLLGGLDLQIIGELTDPILDALAPWIFQFAELLNWFGDFIELLGNGIKSPQALWSLAKMFNPLNLLGNTFTPDGAWADLINLFFLPLNLLLGPKSPLNAANVFGILGAFNFPFLPLSHLVNTDGPNLLIQPGYDDEDSIGPGQGWARDGSVGRTKPGAARATAGGFRRELNSIQFIPVGANTQVYVETYLKWTGLNYTGTQPIKVRVLCYNVNEDLVASGVISAIGNPATNQNDWLKVSDTYIVPSSNVASVKLQFVVEATASSGTVWFDDAKLSKTGQTLPQEWISGLQSALQSLSDFVEGIIRNILYAIGLFPIIGRPIANLLDDLINGVTGWFNDTETAAANASDAKGTANATQAIIIAAAAGETVLPEYVVTPEDQAVLDAVAAQTETITAMGAQVAKIQSQITGSETSGVSVLDPVQDIYVNELNPTIWAEYTLEGLPGDGWMESADGSQITMRTINNNVASTKMYRWIGQGQHTLTNRQLVRASIARGLVYPGLGDGRLPHDAVYCRVSDNGMKWVRAYVDNVRRLVVDYRNDTDFGTLFASGQDQYSHPPPGSSLGLEAGVGADNRAFRVWFGNTPIKIVLDSGNATDINQFGHGIGMRMHSGYKAGAYSQYTAVDNKQIAIPGYGFRVYRSGTSVITKGADAKLDFYDLVQEDTDNAWDSVNQRYVIPTTGWWVFKVRVGGNNNSPSGGVPVAALSLKIDNAIVEYSGIGLRNRGWDGSPADSLNGTFGPYPLKKGQVVEAYMAYVNSVNYRTVGSADGAKTSFAGTLMSRTR